MITAQEYYFKTSLYTNNPYEKEDLKDIFEVMYYNGKVDNYCPFCKKDTTFSSVKNFIKKAGSPSFIEEFLDTYEKLINEKGNYYFDDVTIEKSFTCARITNHKVSFITKFGISDYTKHWFQKVGQYPSIADLTDYKTLKYNKVLSAEKFNELNKGLGLFSHGVGIGSLIYLRRIFEELVIEAYEKNKTHIDLQQKEKPFLHLRMEDKIDTLKPFLPVFLVENKNIYVTMSKGIHKLVEKECRDIFPTVELGIKLMLDEKVLEFEKNEKIKEFNKQHSKINSK